MVFLWRSISALSGIQRDAQALKACGLGGVKSPRSHQPYSGPPADFRGFFFSPSECRGTRVKSLGRSRSSALATAPNRAYSRTPALQAVTESYVTSRPSPDRDALNNGTRRVMALT